MKHIYKGKREINAEHPFHCKPIFVFLCFIFLANFSFAQSIFTNPITDPSPFTYNPFTLGQVINANLTVSGIGRGTGITGNSGMDRYTATNWNAAALDPNKYFTFTITPNTGYLINFISFVYTGQKSATGPGLFAFRSSLDGFTANIGSPSASGTTISLAVAAYQNINTPIEFRFYGWAATSAGGTFSINDFTFNGNCIPGPGLTAGSLTGFGNVCVNTVPGVNVFTVSGNSLTAANVTVGALAGFTYSTDNVNFFATLSIAHGATLASTNIYVKFSPVLVQSYNGNIPIGGGGAPTVNVAAAGSGVNTKPAIDNGTVSGITTNSASVNATVTSTGCTALSAYGVEYSTSPGFANGTGTAVAGGAISGGNFTSVLSGLAPPGTTYYFHTYATNAGGTTYGVENAFTLLNTSPTLSVPPSGAGSLNPFGSICINTTASDFFSLSGSVLNGSSVVIGALTGYKFSTSAGGPFTNTLTLVNGGSPYSYSGGTLSATIYVQFLPTLVQSYNGNVTISGGGAAAITVAASGTGINDLATVTTGNALFITTTGAVLPGTIVSVGCGTLFGYGIEYSTTPGFAPGTGTQVPASNLSSGSFSVTLSTLNPATTYYYYVYASTPGGTAYGTINSFLTATSPTKLVITSISPGSPIALTPFSITVTAVDDLVNMNPTNVTANTDITLMQVAGANVLTFPAVPAGTIPAGASSITISGTFYDVPEMGVGMTATASAGMVSLGTSPTFTFDVVAYTGPSTFIWSGSGNSAWLTGSNWQTGTAPGSSVTAAVNQHLASFTSLAGLSTSATGGCGINMNSVGSDYSVGTIYFADSYTTTHVSDIVPIGNSSTSASGVLSMYGSALNNVGNSGVNYSGLLIANYMNSATTKTLEIRNGVGSGSQNFTLNLVPTVTPGYIVAGAGRTINLNVLITGSAPLTFTGSGTFSLKPSGAASSNSFSGAITVANGTLVVGNTGAFNIVSPNAVTLGSSAANPGILRLDGNAVSIGGLSSAGNAGNSNFVDNGNGAATLTINNTGAFIFKGALKNGSTGILSLIKTGVGSEELQGLSTYTGTTVISNGTLRLNHTGGGTLPSTSSVTVTGTGTLQISGDQTLKDVSLSTGGTLKIDAGITLTVTGVYNAAMCNIINNGTIKMQGTALQSFPGTAAIVSAMNDLTITNAFGVNLNNSLNIGGTLNLSSGTFTVGAYTLTLNNPITGTLTNFSANNTSSIVIAGSAAGVNIPANVLQLKTLQVSNAVGSTLQGNLNIANSLSILATAGTLYDNQYILNGTASVTMTGGIFNLEQNTALLPGLTGVYTLTGGTVVFDGVGVGTDAQTVRPVNYFNLTSASTGDRVLSPSGVIGVSNVFTPNLPNNLYTVINSTVDYNKTAAQSVAGFTYYNMTVSGGAYSKTLAGNIDIQGTLSLATTTKFNLANFNTTLKSTTANTARVAAINTNNSVLYGTGQFIVERYIPSGIAHGKSWQFLSVPVSGTQSVKASWQEGNLPLAYSVAGIGTTISSEKAGATGRGYDFYTPAGPTLKTYNSMANSWIGVDDGSTNTSALPITNKKGYMLFVRGDRSVQTYNAPATVTTLRTSGKIFSPGTDAPPSTTVAAGKLESAGNLYPSALDFTNLLTTSAGIDAKYYVWDPLLPGTNGLGFGGYQLLSSSNSWMPIPGSTANYTTGVPYTKIQSGQAFFVYSTGGGTLNFAETNKLSGSANVFRTAAAPPQRQFFRAWLQGANGTIADGNVVAFDPGFSNVFDADDAIKIDNATESFSIADNQKILVLDARHSVVNTDTVFYHIGNLRVQPYEFHFVPDHLTLPGLNAWLTDRFMGITTPLNLADSSTVSFQVTADSASKAPGRFYVIFKQIGVVPITFVSISAARNNDKNIAVTWKIENETGIAHYQLERSGKGQQFVPVGHSVAAQNSGENAMYTYIDELPLKGSNFYRVMSTGNDGNVKYSEIVQISDVNSSPSISVNPNPVVNNNFTVSFINHPPGHYQLQLINHPGQTVFNKSIDLPDGALTVSFVPAHQITPGIYELILFSSSKKYTQPVLVK